MALFAGNMSWSWVLWICRLPSFQFNLPDFILGSQICDLSVFCFGLLLPCFPCHSGLYPETISPNKLFLLRFTLVMISYHTNIKVTNTGMSQGIVPKNHAIPNRHAKILSSCMVFCYCFIKCYMTFSWYVSLCMENFEKLL